MKIKNNIMQNTIMLLIFNIAKIIFPFITLPYLTRILTTDIYGNVAYVKTIMSYMQIFIDFGFVLSATKEIVKFRDDKNKLENILSDTLLARTILSIIGLFILIILIIFLPILRFNILYTLLSYLTVFLSIFLLDFLFRGIEKMHIITIRFILMKIISTCFTFILIKNDSNILLIPILDIVSSIIAILLVFYELNKIKLKFKLPNITNSFKSIKSSFVYFVSNVASTSLNALSTIIIGLKIGSTEVAYWSVCMQVIGSITACYSPIADGIYPEMIRTKDYELLLKIEKLFIPVVIFGCILMFILSDWILNILGGSKYLVIVPVFRILIPVLFFGFLSIIHGWPALGAIDKNKENTMTTFISITFNIFVMLILILLNKFSLTNIAITRLITEIILFALRYYYCRKYKSLFVRKANY